LYDEQWRDVMSAFLLDFGFWILNLKFHSAVSFEGHFNKKKDVIAARVYTALHPRSFVRTRTTSSTG